MQASTAYEPSKSLRKRIARRIAPLQARRRVSFTLERPIISFTFDDCPQSAVEQGVKPLHKLGYKSTVYIAPGLLGTSNHHGPQMSASGVKSVFENGHEIGGHSYSHVDLSELNWETALSEIARDRKAISDMGLPPCRTFAYPFGQTSGTLKSKLSSEYIGIRGISPGVMHGSADLNQIRSTPLFSGDEFDTALAQIRSLRTKPGWLTLFTHDIQDSPTPWGCTPAQMQAAIDAALSVGADILPVATAIDVITGHSQ